MKCVCSAGGPAAPEYHAKYSLIWVCRAAKMGTTVPWRDIPPVTLVRMRCLAENITNPARGALVRRRMARAIHRARLERLSKVWLALHDATPSVGARVQKCLQTWLAKVATTSNLHQAVAGWWSRHLKVMRGAPTTLLHRCCNHRQVAAKFGDEQLTSPSTSQPGPAKMHFIDESLKVHAPMRTHHVAQKWTSLIAHWLGTANIEREAPEKAFGQGQSDSHSWQHHRLRGHRLCPPHRPQRPRHQCQRPH